MNPAAAARRPSPSVWPARLGRALRWLLIGLAGLLATGLVYQQLGAWADIRALPPPGRLIDVSQGGAPYRLHLNCAGERVPGRPTVILDTLSGGSSALWGWVQPAVAEAGRVCSYDRAGWGWSDAGPDPRDAQQTARELHTLLERAGEPGPFVLVGHSLGGLYVRAYTGLYPDEVAGLVLLDASHPDQAAHLPAASLAQEADFQRQLPLFSALSRLGLGRLYFDFGGTFDFGDLPPAERAAVAAFWSLPRQFDSARREGAFRSATDAQVRAARDLGARPLLVVTAGTGSSPEWLALQADLATLSTNAAQRIVSQASHGSLVIHPDHGRITAQAILDVVSAAASGDAVRP
jgi:pimeloyl-ACP methyl ester carboxylesterase